MSNDENRGGLPAAIGTQSVGTPAEHHAAHTPGFTLNLAGVPIPLRRTFAAIDRLFAIPIEVAGDALEKKMRGNLDSHVENVQKTRRKKGKKENVENPSPKTTKAIADWARRAADVDAEEQDLASLWEALLDAIMDDEDEGEKLLALVKDAQPADIRFFLARYAGAAASVQAEPGQWGRLEDLGLLNRSLPANGVITLCIVLSVILYSINDLAPLRVIGQPPLSGIGNVFRTIADYAIPIGGIFAMFFFAWYVAFVPTNLGRQLCERYSNYKSAKAG